MKKLLAIVWLFTGGLAIGQTHGPSPIKELKGNGIVTSIVLVPKEKFSDSNLAEYATEYLSRYRGLKLVQVGFYTEERTAWDVRGKSTDHFSYDYWKKEYEKRKGSGPIQEAVLLAYGGSATLRIRDTHQNIREIAIVGGNVFHPTLAGLSLSVLHVGFSEQGQPGKLTAHFYLTTPRRITAQEAEKLAKSFFDKVEVRDIDLNLREDEWFIFDTFYPWVNPFTQSKSTPKLEETARSVQFLCAPEQEDACFQSAVGTDK